jgi:DNA-binding PadR family transcriptional regulator
LQKKQMRWCEIMGKGDFLGEFEQLLLVALIRLGPNAYGVPIRQEISKRTGREVPIGQVYATLDRLERKGYVSSRLGEPTPERGGRAKRYFQIEAPGIRAFNASQQMMARMAEGLVVMGA